MPAATATKLATKKATPGKGQVSNRDAPASSRRNAKKSGGAAAAKKAPKSKSAPIAEEGTSPREISDSLEALDSSRTPEADKLLREALAPAPAPASAEALAMSVTPPTLDIIQESTAADAQAAEAEADSPPTFTVVASTDPDLQPAAATAAGADAEAEAAVAAGADAAKSAAAAVEAQQSVAMCMALNRCLVPAVARVQRFNFDLDNLVGFDMQNATFGVLGSGEAAAACATLFGAFSGTVLRACPSQLVGAGEAPEAVASAEQLADVLAKSDVVAIHAPSAATAAASAWLGADALKLMKPGATLLTSSATLCDLEAISTALESGVLRAFGCIDASAAPAPLATKLAALPNVVLCGSAPAPAAAAPDAAAAAPDAAAAAPDAAAAATANAAAEPVTAGEATEGAMRIAFFSSRSYFTERFAASVTSWNAESGEGAEARRPLRLEAHAARLDPTTAALAAGCEAVCLFVNDEGNEETLRALHSHGVKLGERRPSHPSRHQHGSRRQHDAGP